MTPRIQLQNWEWIKDMGPGTYLVDNRGYFWSIDSAAIIPRGLSIIYKFRIKQKK